MRIFFITSKLNFTASGGSIEEFDLMMRELQNLGSDVTAVTIFSDANDIPRPLPYRVQEEHFSSRGLLGIQRDIYRLLKRYESEADFFHVDGHLFLYGAGFYRMMGGRVPVSAFFNRELSSWPENRSSFFPQTPENIFLRIKKKARWLLERYVGMPIASHIDIRSTINPFFQAEYEKFGLKRKEGDLVIGDPMDFDKILADGEVSEGSYQARNRHEGPFTIFYSSRMAPQKGFDVLLEGFARVRNKDQFCLVLGGSGPEEHFARQKIRDLGLEKYVKLTGWMEKERLYEFLKKADIFVQADWMHFGSSMSLFYAMAFGIPSIVPAGGGLAWGAASSALTFKPRDPEDLARAIERLAGDHELRAELSRNCYRRIREDELNYKKQVGRLYAAMQRHAS